MIFKNRICSEHFTKATIVPVFKGKDQTLINNYRPNAFTSYLFKILKTIVKKQIEFPNKTGINSTAQCGFTQGRSLQDVIAALTKLVYSALDKSQPSLAIFINLTKTLDTL